MTAPLRLAPAAPPAGDAAPGATGPADLQLIVGAPAIAAVLGITPRQVNSIREAADRAAAAGAPADCPIGRVPGLGLAARRATLDSWLARHGVV